MKQMDIPRYLKRIAALSLVLSGCATIGSADRSVESYCETLVEETERIEEKYQQRFDQEVGDPLTGLFVATATAAEAMGDIALLSEKLAERAPEEVQLEHEIVAEQLRDQVNDLGASASDPLSAIFGSFLASAANSTAYLTVDTFAQENCGLQIFGSAPVTTERTETADGTVVRNVSPQPEDTGNLLEGTTLAAGQWSTFNAGLTCAGGSGPYPYSSSELQDTAGTFNEMEMRVYWAEDTPSPQEAHDETVNSCGWEPVENLAIVLPSALQGEVHSYGGVHNAYLDDGDFFITLNYAVGSDEQPDLFRFEQIVQQIAANMSGQDVISESATASESSTTAEGIFIRSDGVIELEPIVDDLCVGEPVFLGGTTTFRWAGPEVVLLICNQEPVSIHGFSVTEPQRLWSIELDSSRTLVTDYWQDGHERLQTADVASSTYVALIAHENVPAEGLTAGRNGRVLLVLSTASGEVVLDQPLEDAVVQAVGRDVIWLGDGLRGLRLVDPLDPERGELRNNERLSGDFFSGPEWRDFIAVNDGDTGTVRWYSIDDGSLIAESDGTSYSRDVCEVVQVLYSSNGDTTGLTADGSLQDLSFEPGAKDTFYALGEGWIRHDPGGDLFFTANSGEELWRVDADVLQSVSVVRGRLYVSNRAGERFEIALDTGEIQAELDVPPRNLDRWDSAYTLEIDGRLVPRPATEICP